MQHSVNSTSNKTNQLKIQDFSFLQSRYQPLGLAQRAQVVLNDAKPALQAAEDILSTLAQNAKYARALDNVRKNIALVGKMRPSDARNALLDASSDFIEVTRRKLAVWSKNMQRLGQGEAITKIGGREMIEENSPLASAIAGNSGLSNYLAMIQIILGELVRIDAKHINVYTALIAETRRCSTVLGDYENASAISSSIN